MTKEQIVIIDNKEYILFYTEDDFSYPDLEVALKICLKKDWDKIKKVYEDMDYFLYPVKPMCLSYEELKERAEDLLDC